MIRAPILPQKLINRAVGRTPSTYTFVIPGAPRTKKNNLRRLRRGTRTFTVPSAAFEQWQKDAGIWLSKMRAACDGVYPLPFRVNCAAVFYRDADRGDLVGYMQAVADVLQHWGILKDDVQIVQWDGTRMLLDRKSPRVEVTLEVL